MPADRFGRRLAKSKAFLFQSDQIRRDLTTTQVSPGIIALGRQGFSNQIGAVHVQLWAVQTFHALMQCGDPRLNAANLCQFSIPKDGGYGAPAAAS